MDFSLMLGLAILVWILFRKPPETPNKIHEDCKMFIIHPDGGAMLYVAKWWGEHLVEDGWIRAKDREIEDMVFHRNYYRNKETKTVVIGDKK